MKNKTTDKTQNKTTAKTQNKNAAAVCAKRTQVRAFADNREYLDFYTELIFLKATVGIMIQRVRQTRFHNLSEEESSDEEYESFGVSSRSELIAKLRTLQKRMKKRGRIFLARLAASDSAALFLERLGTEYDLTRDELDIVATAFGIVSTGRFERLVKRRSFRSGRGNEVSNYLTMLAHTQQKWQTLEQYFGPGSRLVQSGILELSGLATTENDFLCQDVEISRRICAKIRGVTAPDDAILAFSRLLEPEIELDRVVYDEGKKRDLLELVKNHHHFAERRSQWKLNSLVAYGYGTTILFAGEPGTGKTLMANALAKESGMKLLLVNVPQLTEDRNFVSNFQTVMMEASLMNNTIVFFDEADELFSDRRVNSMMPMILREFERFNGVCILATNRKQLLDEAMDRRILYKADFELPDAEARREIWSRHLPKELPLADDVDTQELAIRFTFSGGYIKNAVVVACHRLASRSDSDGKIHQSDLLAAARQQRTGQLERLSDRVVPVTRLNDVVLKPKQRKAVEAILSEYRNKSRVFHRWNFKSVSPYGTGTIALFHGPSGSGKTMTAEAIAAELGLNLLNVSANHLVSGYVGQSAQNIHQLFEQAKGAEAILMFDECESLFGARQNDQGVNGAVSRDNNQQTTVLLREIERFDGLMILTSNHVDGDNMDSAFARRIRHHIAFTAPTMELRREIWTKHFPAEAPLASEIDWDDIAKRYEFSGGTIKQIVLKAAFCAAERASEITEKIIRELCAAELENNRVGYEKRSAIGFGVYTADI